jgi:SAM-dependent methyltransferase
MYSSTSAESAIPPAKIASVTARVLRKVLLGKRVSISADSAHRDETHLAKVDLALCIVVCVTESGRTWAAPEQVPPTSTWVPAHNLGIEVETAYRWASHLIADFAVLDVGCGPGHGAALLAESAKSVLGVGWYPQEVEAASRRYGDRARFMVGEPGALGVPAHSFDAVTCFGALEHATDHEPILAELTRALADGGLLIASLPIGEGRSEDAVPVAATAAAMVRRPDTSRPSRSQWQSMLETQFRNVSLKSRRVGIAVSIAADGLTNPAEETIEDAVRAPGNSEACRSVLTLASNGELPDPPAVATITGLTELDLLVEKLRLWEERARRAEAEGSAKHWELVAAREAQRRLRKRLHQLEHRPLRVMSRVLRGKPARLGPGPKLRLSEVPRDWS